MTVLLLYLIKSSKLNLQDSKITYYFLILLVMLMTTSASSQVTADFTTMDSTTACGSLIVEFQDLSTGNPNSWLWDLGNGNISTLKNPVAIYSSAGIYDVKLTVSDGVFSDTKIELAYITVYENPIAVIDLASTNTGCIPLVAEFLDFSVSSVPIASWFWDFGDGGNSSVRNPTYTYPLAGLYTVSLLVTDANTCQDIMIIPDYIETFNPPRANFIADKLLSCNMNEVVSFDDLSTGSNLTYFWDFGDGTTSALQNPIHNYNSGTFTVSLVVNNGVCTDTLNMIDYIEVGAVVTTDFSVANNSGCADLNVQFTDLSTIGVDSWLWNFGDGTNSTLQNPTHIYNIAGNYDVILKTSIAGNCLSDKTVLGAIEVFDKPTIVFSSNATFSCNAPFVVDFIDQTIDAISWNWDFGNSNTSTLEDPTEIYNLEGMYTVTLSVTDINLCTNTLVSANYISIGELISQFSANTLSGCDPLNTTFTDFSVTSQGITAWNWNFGDGNTSALQNPIHLYTTSGFYDVSLQITDNLGCSTIQTVSSYIQVADPPLANFVATPLIVCVGTAVNFSDLSTSPMLVDAWLWDFGDGISATTQNPTHTYNLPGNYNVSLTSSILGCADTFSISNYIQVIEPTAFFTEVYNCPDPLKVDFTNLAIGADFVNWDFGDGTNSTQINPTHIFPSRGTYMVMLSASNTATGCTHDYVLPVKITEPIANFTYFVNQNISLEDSVGCNPHRAFLDNLSQDVSYYKVLWEDGYVGYGRIDHLFDSVGTFDVSMIITDIHGCKDTFVHNNMYSINGIDADFEVTNIMGCDSLLVDFNDLTSPNSSVLWDFGDGGTSTLNQAQHIYYNPGLYDVTLYTESSYGCRDTLQKLQYIEFENPIADFTLSQNTSCHDIPIAFSNLSSGLSLAYQWDFGDGTISANFNTIHSYNQDGVFNVTLSVMDLYGCSKSFMQTVSVQEPIANFTANTVSSNCPPLISDFTNQSSVDATIFSWDFGDGSSSNLNSPSHLYANSGLFDVTLMVENSFGCRDTFVQNGLISISGPMGSFNILDNDICFYDTAYFISNVVNTSIYFWDFGDGTFSTDSFPAHNYLASGVYFPSLILENSSACQFTVQSQDSIVVSIINIDAGNSVTICKNDSTTLLAMADSGNVLWSPALYLSNPNVLNPTAIPNSTTLFTAIISDGNCQNSDTVRVIVNQEVPNPFVSVSNQCEEDTMQFLATSGLNTNNISWFWDLGNGDTSNMQNPTHQFMGAGSFLISLLVTNLDNTCATKIYQNIDVYDNPVSDFLFDEVCFGEITSFSDISTSGSGNVMQWMWNFGDGSGISPQKNPKYQYANDGSFSVSLSVISDYGCENQTTKNVMVNELPIADFSITDACLNDFNLFQSTSTIGVGNITNWYWTFGDGATFVGDREGDHTYLTYGSFDVHLIVTSDKGCKGEITHQALVYPLPNPVFTADNFCEGDITLFFSNSNITSGNIIAWNWNFGDGIGVANYNNPTYQFANMGTYPVSLTIMSDKLCENSITNNISIYPLPTVNIYTDEEVCVGEEIKFTDLSLVENGYITDWNWNLGDGNSVNGQKVSHSYNNAGIYSVSLDVTSNFGCKQSRTYPNMINVYSNPIADFMASRQFVSIMNPEVSFDDRSVDAASWFWDFDNGEISTEQNPTITFTDTGVYIVSLMVTNTYGCSDKLSKQISVRPEFTLFIPNSFTPNGDGLDDDFMAYGEGMIQYKMMIYSRWGENIFQSNDKAFGWNGKNRFDKNVPGGIYLYHITITDFNGKPWVYNGEINLMR